VGATAFLLYRLAERCSIIIEAGRVEWAVLQSQQGCLFIEARNQTHLVVLADDSIPVEDLAAQITLITDVSRIVEETIPRQHLGHDQ